MRVCEYFRLAKVLLSMIVEVGLKQKLPSIDVPKSGHPKTMLPSKGLVTMSVLGLIVACLIPAVKQVKGSKYEFHSDRC